MPLYEYRCKDCNGTVEVIQKITDPDPSDCSNCGGSLERVLSAPSIRFKGSGWYITDYSKKNSSNGSGSSAKKESSSDSASSEKSSSGSSSGSDSKKTSQTTA